MHQVSASITKQFVVDPGTSTSDIFIIPGRVTYQPIANTEEEPKPPHKRTASIGH